MFDLAWQTTVPDQGPFVKDRSISLSISLDSELIFSGTGNRYFEIWELHTGKLVGRSTTPGWCQANDIVVTDDGRYVAFACRKDFMLQQFRLVDGKPQDWKLASSLKTMTADRLATIPGTHKIVAGPDNETLELRVYDLEHDRWEQSFAGHGQRINALAVTPDGEHLVSASRNEIKLWEISSSTELQRFEVDAGIASLIVPPESHQLYIACYDATMHIWNLDDGRFEAVLDAESGKLWSAAISEDGRLVAFGARDHAVHVWDTQSKTRKYLLAGHGSSSNALRFSRDAQYLVSGAADLKIWNMADGNLLRTIPHKRGRWARGSIMALHAELVATPYGDGMNQVGLWHTQTGRLELVLGDHSGYIRDLQITADGQWLVTGSADRTVAVWDLSSKTLAHTFQRHDRELQALSLLEQDRVLSLSKDGKAFVWESASGHVIDEYAYFIEADYQRPIMEMSANEEYLVYSHEPYTLVVQRMPQTERLRSMDYDPMSDVVISADSSRLVYMSRDRRLQVHDLVENEPLFSLDHLKLGIANQIAISADSRYAVASCRQGSLRTILVLDVIDTKIVAMVPEDQIGLRPLVLLSNASDFFVSAHIDGAVSVFDLLTGELRSKMELETELLHAAISADDQSLFVSGSNGQLFKFNMNPKA